MRGVTTLRYLAALDSWGARLRYGAFAISQRLHLPLGVEIMLDRRPGQDLIERDGYRFRPRPGTADLVSLLPIHELLTRKAIGTRLGNRTSGTFIDVGAHCGSFAILLERHFERVIAVEPLPANRQALTRNLELNGLTNKIEIAACAASDRDGEAIFHLFGDDTPSLIAGATVVETVPVTVRTLDGLLRERALEPTAVRLLKIDVEGAECEVIRGAAQLLEHGSPLVIAEANDARTELMLLEEMKRRGYLWQGKFDSRNLMFTKA